jgi:hypothetical protein
VERKQPQLEVPLMPFKEDAGTAVCGMMPVTLYAAVGRSTRHPDEETYLLWTARPKQLLLWGPYEPHP